MEARGFPRSRGLCLRLAALAIQSLELEYNAP